MAFVNEIIKNDAVLVVQQNDFKKNRIVCKAFIEDEKETEYTIYNHKKLFFPVSKYDKIMLRGKVIKDRINKIYYLGDNTPLVIVDCTMERINYLLKGIVDEFSRTRGPGFMRDHSRMLMKTMGHVMRHMEKCNRDNNSLLENFTILSDKCNRGDYHAIKRYIEELIVDDLKDYDFYIDLISTSLIKNIPKKWSKRKLTMIGFDTRDLSSIPLSYEDLYTYMTERVLHPFALISLTSKKCSVVAEKLGYEVNEMNFIFHSLLKKIESKVRDRGDTYLPFPHFKYIAKEYVELMQNVIDSKSIEYELTSDEVLEELKNIYGVVVVEDERLYLYDMILHEKSCISFVQKRIKKDIDDGKRFVNDGMMETSVMDDKDYKNNLTGEQKEAVKLALSLNISCITGGAGVGKTYTISTIVKEALKLGKIVQMTSFTGKAVSRMIEMVKEKNENFLTPITMHRLCHKEEKSLFDFLIIDEASMVTNELLSFFHYHYPGDYQVVFVGDINQLPPIGMGDMFCNLFHSCCVPITKLNKNFRVRSGGTLLPNIHSLTTGLISLQESDDYVVIPSPPSAGYKGSIKVLYELLDTLHNKLKLLASHVRILSFFKEPIPTLNNMMIDIFFDEDMTSDNEYDFFVGGDVMMNENVNKYNIFNGNSGKVVETNKRCVKVKFLDREIALPFYRGGSKDRKNGDDDEVLYTYMLSHAYASTVHKSQGSEYCSVILFCPYRDKDPGSFLTLNNLYTALSRAQDAVYIVGDTSLIDGCLQNASQPRLNNVGEVLKEKFKVIEEYSGIELEYDSDMMEDFDDDDFD